MPQNPLSRLQSFGQSFWLDTISRALINEGTIRKLMDEDGLRGVTSNPAIFQKAIGQGDAYREQIQQLSQAGHTTFEIYETLAVEDIQKALDVLRPVYDESKGEDGFVSLEVSPHLAHDTEGTIEEARRLWQRVDRPNLMIKIPATPAGLPAITQMLTEGCNVNVTLMFSLQDYDNVAEAYIAGLEARAAADQPLDRIASVASFFVSRIDSLADELLAQKAADGNPQAAELQGKVAVANAQLAYQRFIDTFLESERFAALAQKGAQVQRVLWASTSTKNPDYPDVLYVDTLIGPHTVNTMPANTVDAFRDHGTVARTVDADFAHAQSILDKFHQTGIDYDKMTQDLQDEGVDKFIKPFDQLLATIASLRG